MGALLGGRAARIFETVRRAADNAPEAAEVWETLLRNRRAGAWMVIERVRTLGPLRQGSDVERAVGGEGQYVEFKREVPKTPESRRTVLKTIAAFYVRRGASTPPARKPEIAAGFGQSEPYQMW